MQAQPGQAPPCRDLARGTKCSNNDSLFGIPSNTLIEQAPARLARRWRRYGSRLRAAPLAPLRPAAAMSRPYRPLRQLQPALCRFHRGVVRQQPCFVRRWAAGVVGSEFPNVVWLANIFGRPQQNEKSIATLQTCASALDPTFLVVSTQPGAFTHGARPSGFRQKHLCWLPPTWILTPTT